MDYNLFHYLVPLFIGIVLTSISGKIKAFIDNFIDVILDKLNYKKTLYKKRTRDIYNSLNEHVCDKSNPKEKVPDFIFEEWDEHDKIPFNWKIIKIDKTLDKERIDKSIILQLPASSKYYIERNLMRPEYKNAFFLALSRKLALKHKKYDVVEIIEDEVETMGIMTQFQTMCEIINNDEKFSTMILEARRKWDYIKCDSSSTAKSEFTTFILDLCKGNVGILNISVEKPIKSYLLDIKSNLKIYGILHIYARGLNEKSIHLKTIKKIYESITKDKSIKNINIKDLGIYDWKNSDDEIISKARTIILSKK